jgi:predicted phosphoribosyltransferase
VARCLGVPLEVLVTRKIGHPDEPEVGLGAIAEGGEPVFDP